MLEDKDAEITRLRKVDPWEGGMKPLCMDHWDRPRIDCRLCRAQARIQEAIRHGVKPERIEKYLKDEVAADIVELDAKVKAEGLL
ncbi:MAG TPA: hypothetical protein PLI86_00275 [bacterium]|nr:hypothetical protein [bacterium]